MSMDDEIESITEEIAIMRTETSDIQEDIRGLVEEKEEMRADINSMREELAELKGKVEKREANEGLGFRDDHSFWLRMREYDKKNMLEAIKKKNYRLVHEFCMNAEKTGNQEVLKQGVDFLKGTEYECYWVNS